MKITDFIKKKQAGQKISMLTCYDYPSAKIIAESNLDCVLVGDSVAMVVHGHNSTVMATIEMMVLHTAAVARGITQQLVISDLPFLCHRGSQTETVAHVRKLIQAGAQAIKIEGGDDDTCRTIAYLVTAGIPILGHIGLMPQSIHQYGGYKVQGKNEDQAIHLVQQAKNLENAGCSALVLECIPQHLAKKITDSLGIPTIGIGAGAVTDGQVLVWHDMLGLQQDFVPKFVKQFADVKSTVLTAINHYVEDIQHVKFPNDIYAY
ncbi:3-methyl-2-oxobutanoate hydroxymethyltransferase [Legionella beliardensis]|uniref:3-methyl-2-oxobutanoate hydroxymethyltransferase n=1 Tax=Legionella beliardensis TaxID=91822 RepID=A0A378I5C8_9GAMM|nr:3-methyl-2-oxobutanoate hydroxymethyltransferase [Legionella beliardensis]STX30052.1 3-methyl-2-oxobutanoate hydroxymethyltransferase [Legionella beliardensis]